MPEVTLLYVEDCPSWQLVAQSLHDLADEFDLDIRHERIDSPEEAERWGFHGSPTILVDGRDPFAPDEEPVGLACRIYRTPRGPAGAPTEEQLRAVLA